MAPCAREDVEAHLLRGADPDSGLEGLPERRRPGRSLILKAAAVGIVAALALLGVVAAAQGARRGPEPSPSRAPAAAAARLFGLPKLQLPFMQPAAAPPALAAPPQEVAPADAAGAAQAAQGVLTPAVTTTPAPGGCFQTEDGSDFDSTTSSAEDFCVLNNEDSAKGSVSTNLYMYRAGGEADYDLENVNAADLEGVLWYLHNEVVASAPRKYGIDRIRRYQVTIKNTQEFWNVHKKQFGPFLAFDAARCTTVDGMGASTCESVFQKYGFIVGCQPVQSAGAADQAPLGYLHDSPSNTGCAPGTQDCYAPLWYSLPGPCPEFGIPQDAIDANDADQDVAQYKSAECKWRMPGGRCEKANGAPDCTYSVWPAGEIMLDDLSGIDDYQDWWNVSYYRCIDEGGTDCAQNKEYDVLLDAGVGTSFWDNRGDRDACKERVNAVKRAFADRYPDAPYQVDEPICDFDMVYDGEFQWPDNHMGGTKSTWWTDKNAPAPASVYVTAAPSYAPVTSDAGGTDPYAAA